MVTSRVLVLMASLMGRGLFRRLSKPHPDTKRSGGETGVAPLPSNVVLVSTMPDLPQDDTRTWTARSTPKGWRTWCILMAVANQKVLETVAFAVGH